MIIKNYWRLDSSALPSNYLPFELAFLQEPQEFIHRLRPAEGVVLSVWDDQALVGRVSALGVCLDSNASGASIDWREVEVTLKPNPSGRTHWRSKAFFGFAATVIERYGLADLFAERFPDLEEFTFACPTPRAGVARRLPTVVTPGYVYLIKSQHGFKIGKTINMKSRTRLFEVKLPFPIAVEHYAWFENYSEAERSMHQRFQEKRLEGEWFNLDAADIAYIRAQGKPATSEEIRAL